MQCRSSWRTSCCRRQAAKEAEQRVASVKSFLDEMPNLVTSHPDPAVMMHALKKWVKVLLHGDNLEALKTDASLGAAYNKGLCDSLLAAAVSGRPEAIPLLIRVFRYNNTLNQDLQASCSQTCANKTSFAALSSDLQSCHSSCFFLQQHQIKLAFKTYTYNVYCSSRMSPVAAILVFSEGSLGHKFCV